MRLFTESDGPSRASAGAVLFLLVSLLVRTNVDDALPGRSVDPSALPASVALLLADVAKVMPSSAAVVSRTPSNNSTVAMLHLEGVLRAESMISLLLPKVLHGRAEGPRPGATLALSAVLAGTLRLLPRGAAGILFVPRAVDAEETVLAGITRFGLGIVWEWKREDRWLEAHINTWRRVVWEHVRTLHACIPPVCLSPSEAAYRSVSRTCSLLPSHVCLFWVRPRGRGAVAAVDAVPTKTCWVD